MRILILILLSVSCAVAAEDWGPVRFLLGEWVGEGTGKPGEAAGRFSFAPDLQGAVLVRKNYAEYPPQNGKPGFRHEDLMIVFRDETTHRLRANYYDSEGHVIPYAVEQTEKGVVFASEGPKTGPRYRLTYLLSGPDKITIRFEIAPPGKDFGGYIDATATRAR